MKHLINIALLLLVSLTTLGCGDGKKNTPVAQSEALAADQIRVTRAQFEQNDMEFGTLEEKEIPTLIKTTGMIDVPPENRSEISATMGGYIKTLPLLIGDVVKKGQALLTIENMDFVVLQQEYMEVAQQLGYLKSEYDRQKTMYDENITSEKNYLKAQSDYKTAQAKYNGLRKQLTMINISPTAVEAGKVTSVTTIFAPIAGSVTRVNVTKGSYVLPATPIMEIIDNNHIHLELAVFEKDIMKIKKGQAIKFKIPESSPAVFEANVYLVGTSIGEGRTIKVHGHLKEGENQNFLTGMFVEADIVTNAGVARALPSQAVVNMNNKNYVLVLDEETEDGYFLRQKTVIIKNSHEGYTIIENANDFKGTERFLIKGTFELLGE